MSGLEEKRSQEVGGSVSVKAYGAGEGEGHQTGVGVLCSEQSWALAVPSYSSGITSGKQSRSPSELPCPRTE